MWSYCLHKSACHFFSVDLLDQAYFFPEYISFISFSLKQNILVKGRLCNCGLSVKGFSRSKTREGNVKKT